MKIIYSDFDTLIYNFYFKEIIDEKYNITDNTYYNSKNSVGYTNLLNRIRINNYNTWLEYKSQLLSDKLYEFIENEVFKDIYRLYEI